MLDLDAGLKTDDPLKIAHHRRERVRPRRGSEAVVRRIGVGHPVPERLGDRVFQSLRTGFDRDYLGSQQPHPRDVEGLPSGVDRTHVDDAFEVEQRTRGCGGHAVLPSTGLGDYPVLAHLPGQQGLAEHVVDLVRPGVVEVLTLEEQPRPTGMRGQSGGLVERRRTPAVVGLQPIECVQELVVGPGLLVGRGHFLDDSHQRLGDEAATVHAEVATLIGLVTAGLDDPRTGARETGGGCVGHRASVPAWGRTDGFRR